MTAVEFPAETPKTDADPTTFDNAGVATVSSAHLVHDAYTSFLAPLLPVLIENLALTKTAAGMLSVFYQWPSLIQPFIGRLGDRVNLKILVIIAPTIAALMMTMLGMAPTYGLLALLLIVAGFNSAGLHAIGPIIAGKLSGEKLGRGMSFWMVAGELARTFGPLILVSTVTLLTPRGLPWLVFGGLTASAVLFVRLRNIPDYRPPGDHRPGWGEAMQSIRPFLVPVAGLTAARAMLFAGLPVFLPTYLTESGAGLWIAGASLSVMESAGVFGALFGGVVSDRLGRRRVLIVMSLAAPLAVLLFLNARGWLVSVALLLIGLTLLSTTPVVMALVQERAGKSRALANGIYMALNFAISAAATVVVGMIADRFGLNAAFYIGTAVMLLGMPFAFMLPKD